nr:hypothetical protein [uncultured Cupriavidus sp.]
MHNTNGAPLTRPQEIASPSKKNDAKTALQFLEQASIAALVMLLSGAYVWLVQKTYDKLNDTNSLLTPICYAAVILGAGLAYDFAKRILLVPHPIFRSFLRNSAGGIGCLVVMFLFLAVSAHLAKIEAPLAAYFAYGLSLLAIWPTVSLFSKALEAVGPKASN